MDASEDSEETKARCYYDIVGWMRLETMTIGSGQDNGLLAAVITLFGTFQDFESVIPKSPSLLTNFNFFGLNPRPIKLLNVYPDSVY